MNETLTKIIAAAYLHDMGKLLWRGWYTRKKNTYEIAHAQYVFDFFNKDQFSDFWKEVGLLASLHHAKDFFKYKKRDTFSNPEEAQQIAWTIYMADNISSKERIDEETLWETREEHIKHFGLKTVFENLFADQYLTNLRSYIPESLEKSKFLLTDKGNSFEGCYFDTNIIGKIGDHQIKGGFEALSKEFDLKLQKLAEQFPTPDSSNSKILLYALDQLTQNFFSLVPSDAYKSIGDISLYDHTKTTVAIAIALYKWGFASLWNKISTQSVCQGEVSIIAGDFNGIQKYLFESCKSQSWLAKRLRMRSFTVQILNEAIIEFLLEKIWLSRASVLINAGGKFVILSNYLDWETFATLQENIGNFFIENYGCSLKISLLHEIVKIGDIFDISGDEKNTSSFFENLFQKLSLVKYHPYTEKQLHKLFEVSNIEWKKLCVACEHHYLSKDSEETSCQNCNAELDGGGYLTTQNCVYMQYQQWGNFYFDLFWENPPSENCIQIAFNTWDKEVGSIPILNKSINTYIPKKANNSAKSFSELIDNPRSYLCMVKWDVDSMSILLKHGFNNNQESDKGTSIYSVSRIVQFSRMLELFFWKHMQDFLAKEFENCYTIFSWGDDFAFIIPAKQRIHFISRLYEEFENFVAHNNKIHFSVGLSLFKDKTPLWEINRYTETLLKESKNKNKNQIGSQRPYNLEQRSICLYDPDYILDYKTSPRSIEQDLTIKRSQNQEISSGLLYSRYLELLKMKELLSEGEINRSQYAKIWARILYSISRNIKKTELKNEILKDFEQILQQITQKSNLKEKLLHLLLKITNSIYEKRIQSE